MTTWSGEGHVTHIHQVHRSRRDVFDSHDDLAARLPLAQNDAGARQIMRAEAHGIFPLAGDRYPRAVRVDAAGHAGLVHFCAGRLAMQGMVVGWSRNAHPQYPCVIGEAAIGLDDRLRRTRLAVHALHRKLDAVEDCAPDHLAEIRQDNHVAPRVRKPDGLDAGIVAEQARLQPAKRDSFTLPLAEMPSLQCKMRGSPLDHPVFSPSARHAVSGAFASRNDSPRPAATTRLPCFTLS